MVAKKGGVLIRAGHTEASVDIAKISSNSSGAVICEIMNDDGSMAKRDQLFKFAKQHRLQIAKIEDLIEYRLKKENFIKLIRKTKLKFKNQTFDKKVFMNTVDKQNHTVISSLNLDGNNCRVRVFSLKNQDIKKNILNIDEVKKSLNYLSKFKSFVLIIIKNFALNEHNNVIKFMSSKKESPSNFIRNYGVGAQIIKKIELNNLILVTKSKKRIVGLDGFGIKIKKQEIFK